MHIVFPLATLLYEARQHVGDKPYIAIRRAIYIWNSVLRKSANNMLAINQYASYINQSTAQPLLAQYKSHLQNRLTIKCQKEENETGKSI